MTRKRRRQIAIIAVLIILLLLVTGAYIQYRTAGRLGLQIDINTGEAIAPPEYLYSFAGEGANRLARPLGVLVDGSRVYVTDSSRGVIEVFAPRGNYLATWGQGKLVVPMYLAKQPKTGDIYVSDRRLRGVFIFAPDGTYKGEFDPKLPKSELPKFKTDRQWAPVAIAFAPDGALYVTEILNGHRMLIFNPAGQFVRSVGAAGLVTDAKSGEGAFQFPNSIKVHGDEVWIADSNNRRIQVYTRQGSFKRFVVTMGLPRGFDFIPRFPKDRQYHIVVVDTLSHEGLIMNATKGEKELTFGERGVLEGQFSYPNDTSVDKKRRIFIADTANGRVQVWGWPATAGAVPLPSTPKAWGLCLSPLLLLPLLLLLRKRRYFVTQDFVLAIYEEHAIHRMPDRRTRWEVLPDDYEQLKELTQGGISLADLLHPAEHSDSDARALQSRYDLDFDDAVILAVAKRAKLFGTEGRDLKRVAKVLEINVVDHVEFLESARRAERGRTDDGERS
jgi:DNA-binding beta-propeller fold protein YncE